MSLFDSLLGRGSKFYTFEEGILQSVKSRLSSEAGLLFQRQIDAVNKIQRLAEGKEVNLYYLVNGRPTFDKSLCFADMSEEAKLATVKLTGVRNMQELRADVWMVAGRLFSLEFSIPPKQFFVGVSLNNAQAMISDVVIWLDPLTLP